MKHIQVVAAIIQKNNKILCTQRSFNKYEYVSYKYEFPGGKVEQGETEVNALIREIREELDLQISVDSKYLTVEHLYPDFRITMHSHLCTPLSDKIHLKEHVDFKWLEINELLDLDWAEADIPIVEKLIEDSKR